MMNKKTSLLAASTVFCLVMGAVMLLNSDKEDTSTPQNQSLVGNIRHQAESYREKILTKALPEKVTKTQAYKSFVDSKITTDQYLKTARVGQAKEFVKESFKSLKDCYREGCGQMPDEDDGFFDPALTVAQQSLKRVLEITAKSPKELAIKEWISETDLLDLLGAENEGLRKAAFENLVALNGKSDAFKSVLDQARDLEGDSAGAAIKNLLSLVNEDNKQELVDAIALINKEGDSATVLGVLENLEGLTVSQSQINQITEGLCRFKGQKSVAHNVKAMNYYVKTMASNSGIELQEAHYCL